MSDSGSATQFTTVTAEEANRYLSAIHPESAGEETPEGTGAELNMPKRTKRKNTTNTKSNLQNVGSRPVSDLQQSMITDALTGDPLPGGAHGRSPEAHNNKRGPKPSIDPRNADRAELRRIGADMERQGENWEPQVNVYNAGDGTTVYNEKDEVQPSKGVARVRRNQFGGVSMRTLAGNPALRRQLRLGAGEVTGDNLFNAADDYLASTGQRPDEFHTPVSQARPAAAAPKRLSVFEHVEQNGVTEPVEVLNTSNGMTIPNPLHRMRIAAAHFHDATQNIPIRHIESGS